MNKTLENFRANKEIKGIFSLIVKDKKGNVIEEYEDRNLIVDKARYNMAQLISVAANNYYIDSIAFGVGTNDANVADLGLTSPINFAFDSIEYPDNNSVAFNWSLGLSDANGIAITEFGLMSHNGDLFARKVRAAINKTSDFTITGTWKIIF
jgi:hypothetical protein